jgi:hypothetical protein
MVEFLLHLGDHMRINPGFILDFSFLDQSSAKLFVSNCFCYLGLGENFFEFFG